MCRATLESQKGDRIPVNPVDTEIDESWYTRPEGVPEVVGCGGVVLRATPERLYIALVQDFPGTFVLPKGRAEPNESREETAVREVREETGLSDLQLVGKLGIRERLNFFKTEWKVTHYFLFLTENEIPGETLEDRHSHLRWGSLTTLDSIFWPEQRDIVAENTQKIHDVAYPDRLPLPFVPFPRLPRLIGRDGALLELRRKLLQRQSAHGKAHGVVGITGLAGVGKTTLASQYAHLFARHYPGGVFWIDESNSILEGIGSILRQIRKQEMIYGSAEDTDNLSKTDLQKMLSRHFNMSELRRVALYKLNVDPEEIPNLRDGKSAYVDAMIDWAERRDQLEELNRAVFSARRDAIQTEKERVHAVTEDSVGQFVNYLRQSPPSLLIIDELANPPVLDQPVNKAWIPIQFPCEILFTTRSKGDSVYDMVKLPVLQDHDALELLLGRHADRLPALDDRHPEHGAAQQICDMLGNLPIALKIANAHITHRSAVPLASYRDTLLKRGALPVLGDKQAGQTLEHDAAAIKATYDSQWDILSNDGPKQLLAIAAQFPASQLIDLPLLGILTGLPEKETDFFGRSLTHAAEELRKFWLIEMDTGDAIRIQPLIRDYAGTALPQDELAKLCMKGIVALRDIYADVSKMEDQCRVRGIDAVQRDLLSGLRIAGMIRDLSVSDTNSDDLQSIENSLSTALAFLRVDTDALRRWDPVDAPHLFRQQLLFHVSVQGVNFFGSGSPFSGRTAEYFSLSWKSGGASHLLMRTLIAHEERVDNVVMMPDGERMVSCSSDHTIKVWNLNTGREERILAGHTDTVRDVAIIDGGTMMISASSDRTLKIWDLQTGAVLRTLVGHEGSVRAVSVTQDGLMIFSGSSDRTIRQWDRATASLIATFRGHESLVRALALTSDERRILSASSDATLRLWETATGRQLFCLRADSNEPIRCIDVAPDGRLAISGADNGNVTIWNLQRGERLHTLRGHDAKIRSVAFSADGKLAISASSDATIRIWDIAGGEERDCLRGHGGTVRSLALASDGSGIASASSDGTIKLWDIPERASTSNSDSHQAFIRCLAFTSNGKTLFSGSDDRTIRAWNSETGVLKRTYTGHSQGVRALTLSRDDTRLISASSDGLIQIRDSETGGLLGKLEGHEDWINDVVALPQAGWLASSSDDGTIRIWQTEDTSATRVFEGDGSLIKSLVASTDGRLLYSGDHQGVIRVWDLSTFTELSAFRAHDDSVRQLALSANGKILASASSDSSVGLWSAPSGSLIHRLPHLGDVWSVAVSHDGRMILSACRDRSITSWSSTTGSKLAKVILDDPPSRLALSYDGTRIAIGAENNSIFVFGYVHS